MAWVGDMLSLVHFGKVFFLPVCAATAPWPQHSTIGILAAPFFAQNPASCAFPESLDLRFTLKFRFWAPGAQLAAAGYRRRI